MWACVCVCLILFKFFTHGYMCGTYESGQNTGEQPREALASSLSAID